MKKFFTQLKYVKINDILSIFVMLLAIPEAIYLKYKRKNLWLICERGNEARDNGYWLFKYLRENYPQEDVVYAIKKECVDYKKVKDLGEIIEYGGYKHWVYYLAAKKNISSQKGGKPNAAVCYLLEVYEILKNTRIYLKHGIIKDNMEWMHYKNTKISMIICGAKEEYEYVKKTYGYPEESVKYLGLARFDNLHNLKINKGQILVMPTWREWIGHTSKKINFLDTEYYKKWKEFLEDEEISKKLEEKKLNLIFYPHPNMQKYIDKFDVKNKKIKIASYLEYDMQELLKESEFLITDYSSIFMDFAYMRKPILYYQFDKQRYRKEQYQEGYFKYENNGFGPVCENIKELKKELFYYIERNFEIEKIYLKREIEFFNLYDNKNCERIYKEIKKMGN